MSGQANVSWQLIPNAAAGGTSPQGTQYQVQARLNYVVSGTAKSASTQVVTITVLPSPKLSVAYTAPFVVMDDPGGGALRRWFEGDPAHYIRPRLPDGAVIEMVIPSSTSA